MVVPPTRHGSAVDHHRLLCRNVEMAQFRGLGGGGGIQRMDSKILELFQEWLLAFEAVQPSLQDEEMATDPLREIESSLAATPANGVQGLAIKLGLHQFLSKHGDATSALSESAYLDLVRLAGRDPAAEIVTRYQPGSLAC